MSDKTGHIAYETLVDLVEGRVDASEAAALRAHLAECRQCSAELAWLDQTIVMMRTDDLEDAPTHVVARAVRLVRPQEAEPRPTLRQRITAALSFDSLTMTPAFGLRSAGPRERQLLFGAGDRDVDLRIAPSGSRWVVSGQILGAPVSGRVELRGAEGTVSAPLDELCEFSLPPTPAGQYDLLLLLDDAEIEVPGLELGG